MGEPDFVLSKTPAVIDDIAQMIADELADLLVFPNREDLTVMEAKCDALGTVNIQLSNGQGFRISVEEDNLERTGT